MGPTPESKTRCVLSALRDLGEATVIEIAAHTKIGRDGVKSVIKDGMVRGRCEISAAQVPQCGRGRENVYALTAVGRNELAAMYRHHSYPQHRKSPSHPEPAAEQGCELARIWR